MQINFEKYPMIIKFEYCWIIQKICLFFNFVLPYMIMIILEFYNLIIA